MAARRCTSCDRAHPLDTFACPDCGGHCTYDALREPEPPRSHDLPDVDAAELWRFEQLLEAGYPLDAAEELAARSTVDLHQAVDLVERRGCTPELAARILL